MVGDGWLARSGADVVDLVDSAGMASAFEGGGKEDLDGVESNLFPDEASAKAKHVGVVVQTRHASRSDIVHGGSPDAGNLVGSYGNSDAAAANGDTQIDVVPDHGVSNCRSEVGIVDRLNRVSADIEHVVTKRLDVSRNNGLEVEPGVVRAKGDAHQTSVPPHPVVATGQPGQSSVVARREEARAPGHNAARPVGEIVEDFNNFEPLGR